MPVNSRELIKAAELVAECKEMKITVKYTLKGAGLAAATTFVGGLLAGPMGLFAGASLGGLAAYSSSKNKFRSVVQVIREDMSIAQKEKLAFHIQEALKDLDITDAITLFMILNSNEVSIMVIFNVIKNFLESEMNLHLF